MKNHDYATVIEYMIAVTEDIWHIDNWEIKHTRYVIESIFDVLGCKADFINILGPHYEQYKNVVLDNILINDILDVISLEDITFILLYVFDTTNFNKAMEDEDKEEIQKRLKHFKCVFNHIFFRLYSDFAINSNIKNALSYSNLKITNEKVARIYLSNRIFKIEHVVKSSDMYSEEYIDYLICTIDNIANRLDNVERMKDMLINIYDIIYIRNKNGKTEYSEYFINKHKELFNQVTNIAMDRLCSIEKICKGV